jgi:hypothetical protein
MLIGCAGVDGLDVSETKWSCDKKECSVNFYIENTTHNQILSNYAVRAHSRSLVQGEAVRNEVVGEIQETLLINPGERREISHQMLATQVPDNIVVSVWRK